MFESSFNGIEQLEEWLCNTKSNGKELQLKTAKHKWIPHKPTYNYSNNKIGIKSPPKRISEKFSDKHNEYGIGFDENGYLIS